MQQLFMSQQSIKPSYLAFLLVNMCVCVRVCVRACACVVCVCAMQGIPLVVKIKTTSSKSVFRCFRTSRGEKSLPIRSRQRLCVCAVFALPRGFGPRSRQEGRGGSGAPAAQPRPSPPQTPAPSRGVPGARADSARLPQDPR